MSIKKRLILSNIGMIIIPVISLFVIEILLGFILFVVFHNETDSETLELFVTFRFIGIILVLIATNGLLTYYVSKSIITPIRQLSLAARKISEGDLEDSIYSEKKDELAQLANTFDEMRINLKKAQTVQKKYEQNRQELIASISHDLKTPITSIKGYIQGIQDGVTNSPEKLSRYLETINQKANQMDGLIDELFLYSKLDLDQVPFYFETINLYAFLTDYVDELAFYHEKDHLKIKLHADENNNYHVSADREKLYRVITNLIENSLKYMDKPDKTIDIQLLSNPDQVEVKIEDNGCGIPPDELPYIFESFYRTDTSRNSTTGGSGLGLSIVKKVIDAHGGTIHAESQLGEGTTIYIRLKKVK